MRHPLCIKSNLVYVHLWHHAKIRFLDFLLHCRCLCASAFYSNYYITSHTLYFLNHPHLFAIFQFRSRNQFSFSVIILLPLLLYFFPFLVLFIHIHKSWNLFFWRSKNPTSKTVSKVNRAMLGQIFESNRNEWFFAHFSIGRLHFKQFLNYSMSSKAVSAMKIAEIMEEMASARSMPLKLTMFTSICYSKLVRIENERVRQVLRALLSVVAYTKNSPRVREIFYTPCITQSAWNLFSILRNLF